MNLSVSGLRAWSPEALPGAAADLTATEFLLRELKRGVDRAVDAMCWQSPGADAARAAAADLVRALTSLGQSFAMQAEAVGSAARALDTAQDLLAAAAAVAAEHGLTLLEDGDVLPPPPVMMSAAASDAERLAVANRFAAAQEAHSRARAMARQSLAAAGEADRDAAAVLQRSDSLGALLARIVPGAVALLGVTAPLEVYAAAERDRLLREVEVEVRAVPGRGTDPYEVSAWWASLTSPVQRALVRESAELVGNLDGLPARIRDQANRTRLAAERAALEAELVRLEEDLADNWFGGVFTDADAALAYARGKLAGLDRIEAVLGRGDRALLLLDSTGEQLRTAVAQGDVDSADHVAVFTGGHGTDVAGDLGRYDEQILLMRQQADDLAARFGTGSVAAVTWLGYEAPQSVWDSWRPGHSVAGRGAAERGAVELAAFYNGLDAARSSAAHVVALGHSYGSLTTGLALQHGTGVDDVVFFGSPGIGTGDVQDLGVRPGGVFVVEARRDPVADAAAFGPDPNRLDGVVGISAARETVDDTALAESVGHSQYLHPDTASQYGIAAVVAGVPERVPRDSGSGVGDVLREASRPRLPPILLPRVLLPPGLGR